MYKINYCEQAYNDIEQIIYYISHKLNNPTASRKIKTKIINSEKIISLFPHIGNDITNQKGKNYYNYRVNNYYIIYYVDEVNKIINIVRVLYRKRNYESILK